MKKQNSYHCLKVMLKYSTIVKKANSFDFETSNILTHKTKMLEHWTEKEENTI